MTSPKLKVREAICADLALLRALLDGYRRELSGDPEPKVSPYLDAYWSDEGGHPFLLELGSETVGFAFVRAPASTQTLNHQMAEFYVIPSRRQEGLGARAVAQLLRRFVGAWEFEVAKENPSTAAFWHKALVRADVRELRRRTINDKDGERVQFAFLG